MLSDSLLQQNLGGDGVLLPDLVGDEGRVNNDHIE